MTTANKITIARIGLIPVFIMMAVYYGQSVQRGDPQEWQRFAAIIVFIVAAASDGIDGYIARRYNQKSQLGVILDPIADKGLLLAGILTLSFSNWHYEFPTWFPILVVTRDVVIVAGTIALHHVNGTVKVKPIWTGKVATVLQMIAIACVMLQINFSKVHLHLGGAHLPYEFLDLPVLLAGAFTFISGVGYVMEGLRQLNAGGHGNATI